MGGGGHSWKLIGMLWECTRCGVSYDPGKSGPVASCIDDESRTMDNDKQVRDAHEMLDRLGAPPNSRIGSVSERLGSLLHLYEVGKPVPTWDEVTWARFGPSEEKAHGR